jgi:hypothetical protein
MELLGDGRPGFFSFDFSRGKDLNLLKIFPFNPEKKT